MVGWVEYMSGKNDRAMAATVGGMTHTKNPIAREDQEVLDRAVECFGDLDKALDWLQTPNATLKGLAPVRIAADPDGRRAVLNELGRIEHGVFA
jgi:uncharacterized protein (DUF2384 family)